MKKLMKLSAIALLACAVIYSCKKKDEPAPVVPKTAFTTSKLINVKWGMSACTFDPAISGNYMGFDYTVSNLYDPNYAIFTGCAKDDSLQFTASNVSAVNGGYTTQTNTKCGAEKDAVGTWKFNSDQTQIVLTANGSSTTQTFTLLEIADKMMKVKTVMKNPVDATDPKDYTATITFNAK